MEAPNLSPMQRAWLQEIGIDARMLAHLTSAPFAEPSPAAARFTDEPSQQPEHPATRASLRSDAPVGSTQVASSAPPSARAVDPTSARAADPTSTRATDPTRIAELLKKSSLPTAGPASKPSLVSQGPASGDADLATHSTLQSLREHVTQCAACGLHEVRGRTVFGEGVEQSPDWMFIGEAPGEYDESAGRPFQGRAGQLLRAMLASVGLDESAPMYFTNVLNCRPMGNRSPQADEIAACLPLLRQQISLLRPRCLVALGRVSAAALLGRDEDLDTLRGTVHEYVAEDGTRIPVVVTHHPATLLLHALDKADAWRDLNLLRTLSISA